MKTFRVWCLWLMIVSTAFGQNRAVDLLKADSQFKNASWSVTVLDVNTDKPVVDFQSHLTLIPASTLKLITTGVALKKLGKDFTFSTQLGYSGSIEKDVLQGDLVIKGYGDPTFGSDAWSQAKGLSEVLEAIAEDVKQLGINKITGEIIIDNSYISDYKVTPSWLWEDIGNYYASGIWGVNINENMYNIYLQQNQKEGALVTIKKTEPQVPGLTLTSKVKSGAKGTGDEAYIFGAPDDFTREIKGTIPQGKKPFKIKGSIPNPALFLGQSLEKKLAKVGIKVVGKFVVSDELIDFNRTHEYNSPPLEKIIKRANYKSNNLYCEGLFRALGYDMSCHTEIDECVSVIEHEFESNGINTDGLYIKDGSGLSRRNGITTMQLASQLKSFYLDESMRDDFVQSIKIQDYKSKNGIVYLKSGSMGQVRAYAGFIVKGNEVKAFSIIVNNYNGSGRSVNKKLKAFIGSML